MSKGLLDYAREYKQGKRKLEEIPKGLHRKVQRLASDTSVDLSSYVPLQHKTIESRFIGTKIRNVQSK